MRTIGTLLASAACLLATIGCSALPRAGEEFDWLADLAGSQDEDPVQIVAIWTDASLKKAGTSTDTRGFGGRIYFYDAKQRPVEVDGELTVYAFVEKDRQVPSKLPDRKFVFTGEELKVHYNHTALGHSYSIWIPWDKSLDETVSVSLLPTLKLTEGNKVVLGNQSLNVLRGKERDRGVEKRELGVQQVGYESDARAESSLSAKRSGVQSVGYDSDLPAASGVGTTTFDLPPSISNALRKANRKSTGVSDNDREADRSVLGDTSPDAPSNGTVFDLTKAAEVDATTRQPRSSSANEDDADDVKKPASTRLFGQHAERRVPIWKRQDSRMLDRNP